jgi:2-phospho-L-lactate guanylyltransferase (CobY/MobA/RfbA family)
MGQRHEVDVIVLATGFHTTRQPFAQIVRGRGGVTLDEHWAGGMQAYASTTVHGFPNLFVLDGPHASLSHNSAVLMIEAQVEYVLGALRHIAAGRVLEVDAGAEQQYADEIARRSADRPWLSGCANTYVDPRSGRQTLLWPGRVDEFRERLAVFDLAPYTVPARWTVVIPVRPAGKSRLVVPGVDHAELARAIALDTIEAASAVADVRIVTTDPTLALPGTTLVREPKARGITDAVRRGLAGVTGPRAVLLGDLPGLDPVDLAEALRRAQAHTRSAVADTEGTGTTLVTALGDVDLVPSFGDDSWRRHLADGFVALDLPPGSTVRRDVDLAEHLAGPLGPRTSAILSRCHAPV